MTKKKTFINADAETIYLPRTIKHKIVIYRWMDAWVCLDNMYIFPPNTWAKNLQRKL